MRAGRALCLIGALFAVLPSGGALAAPDHLPARFEPAAVADALRSHLENEVLRFWTAARVVDDTHGGFLTWFDTEGNPYEQDAPKALIPQLRVLFVHAVAIERTDDKKERERIRLQYEQGLDFLVEHFLDHENGGWYFEVDRAGTPTDRSKQSVGQAYVAYILSETALRISDSRARRVAQEAFEWLDMRGYDAEFGGYIEYCDLAWSDERNAKKSLGTNMHVALALSKLFRIAPTRLYRERLEELLALLTEHSLVPESDNGLMYFTRDWQPSRADGDPNQQTLYGHNAELMWYVQDVATALGRDPTELLPWFRRVAQGVIRNGLMPDGGVYVWGPLEGAGTDQDDIRWWPQTEAMIMLLRMYGLTREPEYWEAFERVTRFTLEHLVPDHSGAWLGGFNRQTGEVQPRGGWAWKAGLHVSRAMLECERGLRDLGLPLARAVAPRARPRRAVQLEPGFAYYAARSAESIVSEVRANGHDCLHLICLSDTVRPEGIVEEARRQGVEIWASFFPSGVYMADALFPPERDSWRMQFTTDQLSGYRFYSYVHSDYREWWKQHLRRVIGDHPFDGVLFYEVAYPSVEGIAEEIPTFADISSGAVLAFQRATGRSSFPDFADPGHPHYYHTDRGLYGDLVEYRVQSIMGFLQEVLDGPGGLRRAFPDLMFATWTIALAQPGGMETMREREAQDAARLVVELRPDAHFFQSHYPDWYPADQPPTYLRGYEPYIGAVRDAAPTLPLGVQGDVCSTCPYRRDPGWWRGFEETAHALGLAITTYYEFALRWEVYFAPPVAVETSLAPSGEAVITFDQRIAPASCAFLEGLELAGDRGIEQVEVDGNLLRMRVVGQLSPGEEIRVPIGGISDDPSVRYPLQGAGVGEANPIPAGEWAVLRVPAS